MQGNYIKSRFDGTLFYVQAVLTETHNNHSETTYILRNCETGKVTPWSKRDFNIVFSE